METPSALPTSAVSYIQTTYFRNPTNMHYRLPVWLVRNHRRPLRRKDLPPPLLWRLFIMQAHPDNNEDQRNQASHLARHHLPYRRPRDRRLWTRPRRCNLPWRRCQRLLLPLLLLCRPLRPQERHPGPGSLLRRRLPSWLRKVRQPEGAC
jgi:hypothetical protein